MLSNEELKQIAKIMNEELKPINERLDKMDERLDKMDERFDKIDEELGEIKYRIEILTKASNSMSEWIEAASKLHLRDLHYPLEKDEKIS